MPGGGVLTVSKGSAPAAGRFFPAEELPPPADSQQPTKTNRQRKEVNTSEYKKQAKHSQEEQTVTKTHSNTPTPQQSWPTAAGRGRRATIRNKKRAPYACKRPELIGHGRAFLGVTLSARKHYTRDDRGMGKREEGVGGGRVANHKKRGGFTRARAGTHVTWQREKNTKSTSQKVRRVNHADAAVFHCWPFPAETPEGLVYGSRRNIPRENKKCDIYVDNFGRFHGHIAPMRHDLHLAPGEKKASRRWLILVSISPTFRGGIPPPPPPDASRRFALV